METINRIVHGSSIPWTGPLLTSYEMATKSQDPSTQNGAVLLSAANLSVIGVGYNHFPLGVDSSHWHGDKEGKYARVVHAETATLFDAAKQGLSTLNSTLVCAWAACSNCAKHIVAAGVSRLVRHTFSNSGTDTGSHWYADCLVGDEIMLNAGVQIIEVDPVESDVVLRRNGQPWSSKVSV